MEEAAGEREGEELFFLFFVEDMLDTPYTPMIPPSLPYKALIMRALPFVSLAFSPLLCLAFIAASHNHCL